MSMLEATETGIIQLMPRLKWPRISSPALSFPLHDHARAQVEQDEAQALSQIELAYEQNPGELAAIIVETIQTTGGDRYLRREFLHSLRRICDERDTLLIFDETRTGFGLTGQWWDFLHHDVVPDILIFGGMAQVAGVAATDRLDEGGPVLHDLANGRRIFTADLLDMARCRRIIDVIRDDSLLGNATNMGTYLLKLLAELPASHSEVSAVRGRGLLAAFDLPTTEERDRVVVGCFEEELLVAAAGPRSVRLTAALDVSADAVGRGVAQLEAGLRRAFNRRI
jgi:L-lysine 6-transaminase